MSIDRPLPPGSSAPSRPRTRSRLISAGGVRVGRIAGIPIIVSFSWLLSVLLITVLATPVVRQAVPTIETGAAAAVATGLGVLLGVSVLVHELGHCLAARSLGVPVIQVRLYLLGGVSELGRQPSSPREEAIIAASGPGVSALLAGIFGLLVGSVGRHTIGWLLLIELALANGVVAVFNLLPALPLDGGRVLRAGVWQVSGRRRVGTFAAVIGGFALALGLGIWGVLELTGSSRAGVLEGGLAVVMAAFVGLGAAAERIAVRPVRWPADVSIAGIARAVVQLPAESPVALACQVAAGRAVILTGADGIAVGLMDDGAAAELARTRPQAPATEVAEPIRPEMVILSFDEPAEVADRLRNTASSRFLLVDEAGHPAGVVLAADIARILAGRSR